MNYFSYTEAGGHAINEDAVSFRLHPNEPSLLIGALADGQGGRAGGGEAARLAVATCLEIASDSAPRMLSTPTAWIEICEMADRAVSANTDAGFTTLIGVAVSRAFLAGASCGDSAAFLWADSQLIDLTYGQRKHPPVGSGVAELTAFSALPEVPWKLLVVSDGVWKYAGRERIGARLGTHWGKAVIDGLREDVLVGTSGELPDDFTATIIEL
jgi:PPM family protein phosphatase